MSLPNKYTDQEADSVDSGTMEFSVKLLEDAEQEKEKDLQMPTVELSKQQRSTINLEIKMEKNDDELNQEFPQTTAELMETDGTKKKQIMDLKLYYYTTAAEILKSVNSRLNQISSLMPEGGTIPEECDGLNRRRLGLAKANTEF